MVLVLELRAMARLVQRGQQEDMPRELDEALVPGPSRELEVKKRRDLFARVCAPELTGALLSFRQASETTRRPDVRVRPCVECPARQRQDRTTRAGSSGNSFWTLPSSCPTLWTTLIATLTKFACIVPHRRYGCSSSRSGDRRASGSRGQEEDWFAVGVAHLAGWRPRRSASRPDRGTRSTATPPARAPIPASLELPLDRRRTSSGACRSRYAK